MCAPSFTPWQEPASRMGLITLPSCRPWGHNATYSGDKCGQPCLPEPTGDTAWPRAGGGSFLGASLTHTGSGTSPEPSSYLLLPLICGYSVCMPLSRPCLLAEPCPSTLLQRHMADLLRSDRDLAPSFLNSVLNQLNWAFSEFIGMIQEVSVPLGCTALHPVSHTPQGSGPESRRWGCSCSLARIGTRLGWGLWPFFWEEALLSCLCFLIDPAGCRAPGKELCGQPPAEGVRHVLRPVGQPAPGAGDDCHSGPRDLPGLESPIVGAAASEARPGIGLWQREAPQRGCRWP